MSAFNVDLVRERLDMYASRISTGPLFHSVHFHCTDLSNTSMYDLFHFLDSAFLDIDYGVFCLTIHIDNERFTCWFEVTRIFCGKVVYLYDQATIVESCMVLVQLVSAALNLCKFTVFRILCESAVCANFSYELLRSGPLIVFYDRFDECMRAYFGPALDFQVSVPDVLEEEGSEEDAFVSDGEENQDDESEFIYT